MNTIKKSDIQSGAIFRAKRPESFNYQKWPDGFKEVFTFARVTNVIPYYSSIKKRTVTHVFYIPFNGRGELYMQGFVSSCELSEFKREFKYLKFYKP